MCLAALLALASTTNGAQATYASPEEAADALLVAMEVSDGSLFLTVAGPQMAAFWTTDNPIRDSIERDRLIDAAHAHGMKIAGSEDRKVLYIGAIMEPFPAPLVKTCAGWRFDGVTGSAEVTVRRIRQNETGVIELCRRVREAQFRYFETNRRRRPAFAEKIRSAADARDGLFWSGPEGDESLLGPVFAAAAYDEHQPGWELRPLFGYYFRVLSDPRAKRTAPHFAFIAWPAQYGVGGIRSFLITQAGELFQRDLGPDGANIVASFTGIHPDRSWSRLDPVAAAPRVARNRK